MLIGNSWWKLGFIRTAIYSIRLITPASLIYCASVIAVRPPVISRSPWLIFLTTWCSAESLFYLLGYVPLKIYLQKRPPPQRQLSKDERQALITRCFDNFSDSDRYMSKWFLNADPNEIKRENFKDFLAWSLLDIKYEELSDELDAELDETIDLLEKRLGWRLQPGWGKARPLKLAFDSVPVQHRPLVWYFIVAGVECYTITRLNYNGFQFNRLAFTDSLRAFPCRPHSIFSRQQSASTKLSYWYRPHTSKHRAPVLVIHGIGIGLYAYIDFLIEINAAQASADDGDVGIIAVEMMPISSRIVSPAVSAAETREEIKKILAAHCWDEIVLVGHSYGSAIAASILQDPSFPSTSIKMAFLLDPISFMLHLPDVAYNFTRRQPSSASEWMLHYFTSTDLLISHTIARRFQWKDLILFKEDVPGNIPLTVTLSGQDIIVPAPEVWHYLTGKKIDDAVGTANEDTEWTSDDGKLHVFWFAKMNHADIFATKGARRGIASLIRLQNTNK